MTPIILLDVVSVMKTLHVIFIHVRQVNVRMQRSGDGTLYLLVVLPSSDPGTYLRDSFRCRSSLSIFSLSKKFGEIVTKINGCRTTKGFDSVSLFFIHLLVTISLLYSLVL